MVVHTIRLLILLFLCSCCCFGLYTWVDLTQKELEEWYTPTDLCMLESTDRAGFPQHYRAKNCSAFSRGSSRLFCAVGLGSNKQPCFNPMASRPSFKRGLKGFTDASKTPLTEAFANFARANVTVMFLGDSTTRQKITALECELVRENPKHVFKGITFGILPCHTEFEIRLADSMQTVKMHGVSIGPNSADCLKGGLGRKDPDGGGVYENARHIIGKINEGGGSVFVLANLGLWYNDENVFEQVIPSALDWLTKVAKNPAVNNVVAWHETMSQHWPNEIGSGYFNKQYADDQEQGWVKGKVDWKALTIQEYQVPHCCAAITNTSHMADWRNDLVKKHLQEKDRRKYVNYLPFVEITRATADMHVCHQDIMHDCTHYCYWPLVWQPLWHQIARLSTKFKQSY